MKHQMRVFCVALWACVTLLCGCAAGGASAPHQIADTQLHTALDDYIAQPDAAFKWSAEKQGNVTVLKMDSQQWQGEIWHHEVTVVPPTATNLYPDTAVLMIDFGNMRSQIPLMQQAANLLGATFVMLNGIPNQPRWGKREDDLIAHTFKVWYDGGDDTWPLLLPMTKSAIRAMDAVQDFSEQKITKFVTTGASKRGWTTWLTASQDKRIIGIIPIVFNMLNFSAQLPHQKEAFGEYSDMIRAYTEIDLPATLKTPRGKELEQIVDPWAYRERIMIPKLIINGTNDPYFASDAEVYYRDGLRGPTNFYDAPNAGHGQGMSITAVLGTMVGWFRWLKSEQEFPVVKLTRDKSTFATVSTSPQARTVTLWVAHSPTRDFRTAKWNGVKAVQEAQGWKAEIAAAPAGTKYTAVFGEAEFNAPGTFMPLKLSSPIEVTEAAP